MKELSRLVSQILIGIPLVMGIIVLVNALFGESGSVDETRLAITAAALFMLAAVFVLIEIAGHLGNILVELSQLNERDQKMAQWQIKQSRSKQ